MKTWKLLLAFVALVLVNSNLAKADGERYETITVSATPVATNINYQTVYSITASNSLNITDGEVGELVSVENDIANNNYAVNVKIIKGGVAVQGQCPSKAVPNGAPGSRGTTVAGPAQFVLYSDNQYSSSAQVVKGLMTVRITPMTYASDKTVLVAPGMGSVTIKMESSTNLNQWVDATNGVYTDDMKFFRIKLEKNN